jgi:putative ABC transport system ATP-binding protein
MIEIRNATYRWRGADVDCLDIQSLDLAAGASLFLHGPSGSGKSTLLGLLAGVLAPSTGEVKVLGTALKGLTAAQRDAFRADHVGYIFQQFNLLPYLSVEDNVLLACRFSAYRARRADQAKRSPLGHARHLLKGIGLDDELWHRKASELSVGQQQRVAAARALIGSPELVIADEPTSALDAALRDGFMRLLLAECERAGSALVFVSHDERLAEHFDQRASLPAINRAGTRTALAGSVT